ALAVPALSLHTQLLSFTDLPKSVSIVGTYDRIQAAFPGAQVPAEVVVKAPDVTTPTIQQQITRLEQLSLATGQMTRPIHTRVNPSHTVEVVSIPLQGNGENGASKAARATLRNDVIPATIGATAGATV